MKQSESLANLGPALVKVQQQLVPAARDEINPYFKSKYSSITAVWEACREALQSNGFSVAQFPVTDAEGIGVETLLLHESGEWISGVFTLPVAKQDAQGGGACITYARRYALASIVGVCPEDDDANAAADASKRLRESALSSCRKAAQQGQTALAEQWQAIGRDARQALGSAVLADLKKEAANAVVNR